MCGTAWRGRANSTVVCNTAAAATMPRSIAAPRAKYIVEKPPKTLPWWSSGIDRVTSSTI
jgi:hypothetical protein